MLTILESIELSTEYLRKKGIESPRINAESLLASVLNCKRLDLYLAYDKPIIENELIVYRNFIKRRGNFEPLQYITGSVEFYGLNFKVNPSVLIPRPETELLVETILDTYKSNDNLKILDIGSGSGNIAISIAYHLPDSKIIATDISTESLQLAIENAKLNSVEERIQFLQHDILTGSISNLNEFDIVVSNPPYVSEKDYISLQNEIIKFEPKIAVSDFDDGYKFYKAIASKSSQLLKKKGRLFFELSGGQRNVVEKIMTENNLSDITVKKDYSNIERIIYGVKN
ncbi:MAG TPA: peptide chain release factor N(5)-glutamine methyltransferase [Ignavibacteriaceae bacterium]|nr:peptide chain release factor N(5)-glutamine methyltransferase [Ignavibacteriaceae bacterium]